MIESPKTADLKQNVNCYNFGMDILGFFFDRLPRRKGLVNFSNLIQNPSTAQKNIRNFIKIKHINSC